MRAILDGVLAERRMSKPGDVRPPSSVVGVRVWVDGRPAAWRPRPAPDTWASHPDPSLRR